MGTIILNPRADERRNITNFEYTFLSVNMLKDFRF